MLSCSDIRATVFWCRFPQNQIFVPKGSESKKIAIQKQLDCSGYPIGNTFERKPRLMLGPCCSGKSEDITGGAEIRGIDGKKQG